jgi:HD-GYP domain-containing protein (c-di-GMP phosphodiesterase class II)
MSTNRLKIEVNALKEGMFVSDLDCPWHETPFPLQGFYIRLDDDVQALTQYCKYVYIDIHKQKSKTVHAAHAPLERKPKIVQKKHDAHVVNLPPIVIKSPKTYEAVNSIHKEVAKAEKLHRHIYEAINHVFASVRGENPSHLRETVKETEKVAEGMVESVIRNPDALVWLAKMNDQDAYSYQHCVKASIWSLVFGRHLGLDKVQLKSLAMGVLLAHIGKAKISQDVLNGVAESDSSSQAAYQEYIQHSINALSDMDDLPKGVLSIVEFHQERHNGTGFPKGVTGERIPLLAKIAGLVHYYQELITPRNNDLGLSPLAAVSTLYELRNVSFQQDIVERFIEAVGVFPTGTLVELSSNEIGIVTGHNQDRRLLPKVMVVLDENRQKLKHGRIIDLKELSLNNKPSQAIFIKDSLPKGAYDIDENQYLLSGATSKWSWRHIASSLAAS